MSIKFLAVAVAAVVSGSAFGKTVDLGVLDGAKPLYNAFTAQGDFTDYYSFSLVGPNTGAVGDTTTVNFDPFWGIGWYGALLTGGGTSQNDLNPNDGFAFSGLVGGTVYTLALSGNVYGAGGSPFMPDVKGMYAGTISPVPEPAVWAMGLLGLVGVGVASRRRKSA